MTTDHVASDVSRAAGQDHSKLLRRSLRLDAVASGALGILLLVAGPP